MKKRILLMVLLIALTAVIVSCSGNGAIAIEALELPTVFQLGEKPDLSQYEFLIRYSESEIDYRSIELFVSGLKTDELGEFTYTIRYGEYEITVDYVVVEEKYLTITYDSSGGSEVANQTVLYGTRAECPEDPTLKGYSFEGWYDAESAYDFDQPIVQHIRLTATWKPLPMTVTFVMLDETIVTYVDYNSFVTEYPEAERFGYEFIGWYINGEIFDPNTVINEDITIIGKYEVIMEEMLIIKREELASLLAAFDKYFYVFEDYRAINQAYDYFYLYLGVCDTKAEMDETVASFKEEAMLIPDVFAKLRAMFNGYVEEDYFAEDWLVLVGAYENGMEKLNSYNGGSPYPVPIYTDAVKAMAAVTTMEEDIELSKYVYSKRSRELDNLYFGLIEFWYVESDWNDITALYKEAVADMAEAVGTRAIEKCFQNANAGIRAFVKVVAYEQITSLIEYFDGIDENEYFAEDYQTIVGIFQDALNDLRTYTVGAPEPSKILSDAILAMDKVLTKEEDVATTEYKKNRYIFDLQNYVNSLVKEEYTEENYAEVQSLLAKGIESIENAVGTRELINAYESTLTAIKAVEKII
ncbi:MAG: InlB B-repeat-containing protein [Clostridia bacterium]|nr:InlB B-repeat-containing protein [Clostridia bacterium]